LHTHAKAGPSKFCRMQAAPVGHEKLVICVKTGGQIAQPTLVTWPFQYYTQAAQTGANGLPEIISTKIL